MVLAIQHLVGREHCMTQTPRLPETFEQSLDAVAALVRYYRTNVAALRAPAYKEAHARQDLIDPLFLALGWDVHNTQRVAPDYREVMVEDVVEIAGQKKAPDYVFRVGRERKFFAEAKRPGVALKTDAGPAYQLRRYAWSAKLPLSLLTDFEELAVYDCRTRPAHTDKPSAGRTHFFTCEEYPDRWREVWDIFSRLAVLGGSFDQYVQSGKGRRGTSEVDIEFLKEIEDWRDRLAHNIALRNAGLSPDDLSDAVQRTIDRIIFLRIAEDRGLEEYGRLQRAAQAEGVYGALLRLYGAADARYNSGLFDFSAHGDHHARSLAIDDAVLRPILADLYFPQSPYEFSVLPPEILGNVYEQFLGKVIRLTGAHRAKVEEKPEVRKAGGVYYTPAYIVDYIVRQTVGPLVEGKGPKELEGFRVLDPACGSGSFLLGAYQFLLDHYRAWYADHNPERHKHAVREHAGAWRLTTAERKRILTAHLFGVDIDRQAVEVTKLSLLLKVLEREGDGLAQLTLLEDEPRERALPSLDRNVKCGNSLIGPDYFAGQLLADEDELRRVNPFDWAREFPEAMRAGGFDAVVGNPPYVSMLQLDKTQPSGVKIYWKNRYRSAAGAFDIYVLFVERGLELTKEGGYLSYIIPNKFLAAEYAQEFRKWLLENSRFLSLLDFSQVKVWPIGVYPVVPVFQKAPFDEKLKILVLSASDESTENLRQLAAVPCGYLTKSPDNIWSFMTQPGAEILLKIIANTVPLEDVAEVYGASTVAEGSEYPSLLVDHGGIAHDSKTSRFLVSGSVLRYATSWLADSVQFTHQKYTRPRIKLAAPMPDRRIKQAQSPKIIVCKVALEPRAFLDATGEYVGAYTTYILPRELSLAYLTGIINSRLMNFLYRALYGALAMGGGYLRFQPPQMRRVPIPTIDHAVPADVARRDRMVALVERMLELQRRLAAADSDAARQTLERQIAATDAEIDRLVYELYGLTAEEIAVVEGGG
jgi:hypothetical protein